MNQLLTGRPLPGARLNMSHPLTKGLVGCWLLNEQGGTIAMDLSPYGNHGKLVGFASPPHRPFNGLPFAGAQFIKMPDGNAGSPLNFTTQDFTIIVWYNPSVIPTDDATSMMLVNRGLWNEDGFLIWFYSGNAYRLITAQAAAYQNNASSALGVVINTWYMAGIVRSGASVLFYHNGRYVSTGATSIINPTSSTKPTRIGIHNDETSYPFKGKQGLVYVWKDRALLPSDIQWLYQEPYAMFLR